MNNPKVLILGVTGLLGFNFYKFLKRKNISVIGTTTRSYKTLIDKEYFFDKKDFLFDFILDKHNIEKIATIIENEKPDIILNCICKKKGNCMFENYEIPRYLDSLNTLVINISSDVVYFGNSDEYFQSKKKLEDETLKNSLTIRTSFFGHNIFDKSSLLDRLVHTKESQVVGFNNYVFNALPVETLIKKIFYLASNNRKGLVKIYNKKTISRVDFIRLVNETYNLNKIITEKTAEKDIISDENSDLEIDESYEKVILRLYKQYCTEFFETIKKCRHCNSEKLVDILDLGIMPLAGNFIKSIEDDPKKYPLNLLFCKNCECVQVKEIISQKIFFEDYRYESSVGLSEYFEEYANWVKENFPSKKNILEIGCNDGVLLEPLKKSGFETLGIDPAKNIVEKAKKRDLEVICDFFNENTRKKIEATHGKMDLIIANNVMAHIENIAEVLTSIKNLLDSEGFFIFEVQYLKELVEKFQYDFIYHEHIFYYSITAIENILEIHDMKIYDIHKSQNHGGSIRVIATKKLSLKSSYSKENEDMLTLESLENFTDNIKKHKQNTKEFFRKIKSEKIVAYGASGRSVTYTNYCNLTTEYIDFFVDDSPERQNRFIPGVNIPIKEPGVLNNTEVDYILITAWTYKEAIIKKIIEKNTAYKNTIIPFKEIRFDE